MRPTLTVIQHATYVPPAHRPHTPPFTADRALAAVDMREGRGAVTAAGRPATCRVYVCLRPGRAGAGVGCCSLDRWEPPHPGRTVAVTVHGCYWSGTGAPAVAVAEVHRHSWLAHTHRHRMIERQTGGRPTDETAMYPTSMEG